MFGSKRAQNHRIYLNECELHLICLVSILVFCLAHSQGNCLRRDDKRSEVFVRLSEQIQTRKEEDAAGDVRQPDLQLAIAA